MFCRRLVQTPGTAIWRDLRGADADWTLDAALMARAIYALEVANWQRGADEKEAKKPTRYPTPILPPSERAAAAPVKSRPKLAQLLQFYNRDDEAKGA
jgi:hypothetical protein